MHASSRTTGKTLWVAVRAVAAFTLVLGVGYTALITGVGQLVMPAQANGSLIEMAGDESYVGSSLIGQTFTDANGDPLPQYFQPRPSAAGDGYDGASSSGSNWGPENADLVAAVSERRREVAALNGVDETQVPMDAVTASASGLDPHISPEYAKLQLARVAAARELSEHEVLAVLGRQTSPADLGYIGEPRVNVLELNLELDELEG